DAQTSQRLRSASSRCGSRALICRTGEAARGLWSRRVDPGRGDSDAVVLGYPRACRRWGPGHQRHPDRRQDGGNGREAAAARGPRRKPRLRLRPATDRDPGRVPEPSQGAVRRGLRAHVLRDRIRRELVLDPFADAEEGPMTRDRGNAEAVRSLVRETEVHRDVYIDDEVFALEMEHLFANTWIYVGHDSQVAKPGDYFGTTIGAQPVLMVRHADNSVKVLHNRCPHK